MVKLGLALGGGGVAGCTHIGIIKALEEADISIHCLAGTSSGAFVSALYSYGYTTRELIDMAPTLTKQYLDYDVKAFARRLIRPGNKIQGLIRGKKLHNFISKKTNYAFMFDLKKPVAILSADLKQGRRVIFSSRPISKPCPDTDVVTSILVADAVQSSCSIPVIFQPVVYQDRVLVDGGVVDNCPVFALRKLGAEKMIAVNLVTAAPSNAPFDSWGSILSRVIAMNLAYQAKHLTENADLVLQPKDCTMGVFDFSQAKSCIDSGYEYTRRCIDQIKELLKEPVSGQQSAIQNVIPQNQLHHDAEKHYTTNEG